MNIQEKRTSYDIYEWIDYIISEETGIDLLITDPPYPFDNRNGTGRHDFIDGEDKMYTRMTWEELHSIFSKMKDVMNEGGRLYVFCNRDGAEQTKQLLIDSGFRFLNTLIWDKRRMGGGYHWRNCIEYIHYVCLPPAPATFVKGAMNKFEYKKPTKTSSIDELSYYPHLNSSPKPWEIWRDIIKYGAADGDIVADPFSGSNPLSVALHDDEVKSKIELAYTNTFDI